MSDAINNRERLAGLRPLDAMPMREAMTVDAVFTDLDDTLTTQGRLPGDTYLALEQLHHAGLSVAIVTGRPAGWCDFIARCWPVDGVIGENGAFYFSYDTTTKTMRRRYAQSLEERDSNRQRLADLCKTILREVPGAALATDQFYREADLAIDFCEDVQPLSQHDVQRIAEIFEQAGATAKISSIHVNGYFGAYDKLTMAQMFGEDILDLDVSALRDAVLYCGDSPNDAPMFAHFPVSCGVANVLDFEAQLPAFPRYVTARRGGDGFVEVATKLLEARAIARPRANHQLAVASLL